MTKEEKKQVKAEKREARRERRAQNPSRVRRSIAEVSDGVQSVRELYRDMNVRMNEGYEPEVDDEEAGEAEESTNSQQAERMRHSKGKFKIKTRPTTGDIWGFILDSELRAPVGIVGIGVDVAVLILFVVSLFSGSLFSVILLLVVLLITLLLIGPLSHLAEAYTVAKRACSSENAAEYTFSTSGFDIQYNDGEYVSFDWDCIYRIREAGKAFYFFLDKGDGFVIPKADIAAAGRKSEQFAELLEGQSGTKFTGYRSGNKAKKV